MTTERRLAAVERQLRFHRAVIAGLLFALVAFVGYGATKGVPEVVRARSFEVVNAEGQLVAALVNTAVAPTSVPEAGAGGQLWIGNGQGEAVVIVGGDHYGIVFLADSTGKGRTLTPR